MFGLGKVVTSLGFGQSDVKGVFTNALAQVSKLIEKPSKDSVEGVHSAFLSMLGQLKAESIINADTYHELRELVMKWGEPA